VPFSAYGVTDILMQPDTVPPSRLWGSGVLPDMEADYLQTLPVRFVLS